VRLSLLAHLRLNALVHDRAPGTVWLTASIRYTDPKGPSMSSTFRRTALAAGVIAVAVAGVAGLASSALFTDSASVTGNSFTAGTVSIANGTGTAAFNVSGLAPLSVEYGTVTVDNDGSLGLRYAVTASTTNADSKGLASALQVTAKAIATTDTCNAAVFADPANVAIYSGSLADFALGDSATGAQAGDRALGASDSEVLCLKIALPSTGSDNALQGSTTSATFTFDAEQTANN